MKRNLDNSKTYKWPHLQCVSDEASRKTRQLQNGSSQHKNSPQINRKYYNNYVSSMYCEPFASESKKAQTLITSQHNKQMGEAQHKSKKTTPYVNSCEARQMYFSANSSFQEAISSHFLNKTRRNHTPKDHMILSETKKSITRPYKKSKNLSCSPVKKALLERTIKNGLLRYNMSDETRYQRKDNNFKRSLDNITISAFNCAKRSCSRESSQSSKNRKNHKPGYLNLEEKSYTKSKAERKIHKIKKPQNLLSQRIDKYCKEIDKLISSHRYVNDRPISLTGIGRVNDIGPNEIVKYINNSFSKTMRELRSKEASQLSNKNRYSSRTTAKIYKSTHVMSVKKAIICIQRWWKKKFRKIKIRAEKSIPLLTSEAELELIRKEIFNFDLEEDDYVPIIITTECKIPGTPPQNKINLIDNFKYNKVSEIQSLKIPDSTTPNNHSHHHHQKENNTNANKLRKDNIPSQNEIPINNNNRIDSTIIEINHGKDLQEIEKDFPSVSSEALNSFTKLLTPKNKTPTIPILDLSNSIKSKFPVLKSESAIILSNNSDKNRNTPPDSKETLIINEVNGMLSDERSKTFMTESVNSREKQHQDAPISSTRLKPIDNTIAILAEVEIKKWSAIIEELKNIKESHMSQEARQLVMTLGESFKKGIEVIESARKTSSDSSRKTRRVHKKSLEIDVDKILTCHSKQNENQQNKHPPPPPPLPLNILLPLQDNYPKSQNPGPPIQGLNQKNVDINAIPTENGSSKIKNQTILPTETCIARIAVGSESLLKDNSLKHLDERISSQCSKSSLLDTASILLEQDDFSKIDLEKIEIFQEEPFKMFTLALINNLTEPQSYSSITALREKVLEERHRSQLSSLNKKMSESVLSPKSYNLKRYELEKWVSKEKKKLIKVEREIKKNWSLTADTLLRTKRDLIFLAKSESQIFGNMQKKGRAEIEQPTSSIVIENSIVESISAGGLFSAKNESSNIKKSEPSNTIINGLNLELSFKKKFFSFQKTPTDISHTAINDIGLIDSPDEKELQSKSEETLVSRSQEKLEPPLRPISVPIDIGQSLTTNPPQDESNDNYNKERQIIVDDPSASVIIFDAISPHQTGESKENLLKLKGIPTNVRSIKQYLCELKNYIKSNYFSEFLSKINSPLIVNPKDVLESFHYLQADADAFASSQPAKQDEKEFLDDSILKIDVFIELEEKLTQNYQGNLINLVHIHNKLLFDSVNEALDNLRIYKLNGKPLPWKSNLKHIHFKKYDMDNFDSAWNKVEEVVIEWALYMCGFLSDKEDLILPYEVDADSLNQIREEGLLKMLSIETYETEDKFRDYEDEITDVAADISGMVFDDLINEICLFLKSSQQITKQFDNFPPKQKLLGFKQIQLLFNQFFSFFLEISNKKKSSKTKFNNTYDYAIDLTYVIDSTYVIDGRFFSLFQQTTNFICQIVET